ncbi:MAG: DUF192 domain-containing protein [Desulfomonilaceae bacterium]
MSDTSRKIVVMLGWLIVCQISILSLCNCSFCQTQGCQKPQYVSITIGSKTIKATLANTGVLRVEGLLGWSSIDDESGMLLDFMTEGIYAIHMQGMKFAIDAIWIDSSDTVRLIYEDIKPNSGVTYPSMFPARYCLEVAAGFCRRHNVRSGQKMKITPWTAPK